MNWIVPRISGRNESCQPSCIVYTKVRWDGYVGPTEIDMSQKRQIESGPDRVMIVPVEDDLAAIVAIAQGAQDGRRVVGAVAAAGDVADFLSVRRRWKRLEGTMGPAEIVS